MPDESKVEDAASFPDRWELLKGAEEIARRDILSERHQSGEEGFLFGTAGITIYRTPNSKLLFHRSYFAGDGCLKDEITLIDPVSTDCLQWDGLAPHYTDRGFNGHQDTWRDLCVSGYEHYKPLVSSLPSMDLAQIVDAHLPEDVLAPIEASTQSPEQSLRAFFHQVQEAIFLGAELGEEGLALDIGVNPSDFQTSWVRYGLRFGLRVVGQRSILQKAERDPVDNVWSVTQYLYDTEELRCAELKATYTDEEYRADDFQRRVREDLLRAASQGLTSVTSESAGDLLATLQTALQG